MRTTIHQLCGRFSRISRILLILCCIPYSQLVSAVPVEAEGRSIIGRQSIDAAREEAIRNASQQALLQAGAYISATQTLNQGVIGIDNVRVRSAGKLTDVEIIDERIQGDQLIVKIRAEVETDGSCSSSTVDYLKSAAVTGFTIEHPAQANLGALHDAPSVISQRLTNDLNQMGHLQAMNAGNIRVLNTLSTAAGRQQDDGRVTQNLQTFASLDVQFVISGVIRDLRKYDPSRSSEGNFFTGVYDQLDYRGQQHMRNFAVEVFIHDGYTGALLSSQRYRAGGLWRLDDHERVGFGSAAFLKTEYGQKVNELLGEISKDLDKSVRCEPFRTRIVHAEGNLVTFNAGTLVGIRPGDKMTVYRKSVFYDQMQQPHTRLENTKRTMVVNEVHPQFGIGRIDANVEEQNIQQDDVLLAW